MNITPIYTTGALEHTPFKEETNGNYPREMITCPEKDNRTIATVPVYDNEGKANLQLFLMAPEMYDLLLTLMDRLEDMLQDRVVSGIQCVREELNDLQTIILECINLDGQLRGVAVYSNEQKSSK